MVREAPNAQTSRSCHLALVTSGTERRPRSRSEAEYAAIPPWGNDARTSVEMRILEPALAFDVYRWAQRFCACVLA